ncbi:DUF6634 family protein [Devosia albogilva]|uniref:DUF6634 family protein n=1 Tax=Devosia albogilva TaxID=429726 RepID=A0ABW5QN08_9HYPH
MSRRGNPVNFLGADPLGTADRLEELAADLRRLAKGCLPTTSELAEAPILLGWVPLSRPCTALAGPVEGHPRITDHRPAVTSELFAIDSNERWARTMSRYYRLTPRSTERKRDE